MRPLDEFVTQAVALMVDGNAASRSSFAQMLLDAGVVTVVRSAHPHEGRRLIETRRFDIVEREPHFDHDRTNGLELMDDPRQAAVLSLSTGVVKISSEAAYARVAAAELAQARRRARPCLAAGRAHRCRAVAAAGPGARRSSPGGMFPARRTLESLLGDHPGYADACDVMGRVLFDQGDTWAALEVLEHFETAVPLGLNSRELDRQGPVQLAALQFDQRDRRGLAVTAHSMTRLRAGAPDRPRLRRFETSIGSLHGLAQRQVPQALAQLRDLLDQSMAADPEFEAACNLMMVLSRVDRVDRVDLYRSDLDDRITRLAERFAVSRTTCELFSGALRSDLALASRIRDAYAGIGAIAEEAISLTVAGRPREAVLTLLAQARRTLNAKLKDLALHTLDRHAEAIPDAQTLRQEVVELQERFGSYGTPVRLARIDDARSLVAASRPG